MRIAFATNTFAFLLPIALFAGCGAKGDPSAVTAAPDAANDASKFVTDVLDDWEDGNLDIKVAGGRFGHWYNYDDQTEGNNNVAVVTLDLTTERHETYGSVSKMAMRVQASGYTKWGSGYSADIGGGSPYDVSAYTGIVLWTRNLLPEAKPIRVVVADASSDPRGGLCDKSEGAPMESACYDAFGQDLELLPGAWQMHLLPFWSLRQLGYGRKEPALDTRRTFAIAISNLSGIAYDYQLDDVALYIE